MGTCPRLPVRTRRSLTNQIAHSPADQNRANRHMRGDAARADFAEIPLPRALRIAARSKHRSRPVHAPIPSAFEKIGLAGWGGDRRTG
jgi:hypothetical protein